MPLNKEKFNSALGRTQNQVFSRECSACHEYFDTTARWEKRCNQCRMADMPHTKRVFNPDEKPF